MGRPRKLEDEAVLGPRWTIIVRPSSVIELTVIYDPDSAWTAFEPSSLRPMHPIIDFDTIVDSAIVCIASRSKPKEKRETF